MVDPDPSIKISPKRGTELWNIVTIAPLKVVSHVSLDLNIKHEKIRQRTVCKKPRPG